MILGIDTSCYTTSLAIVGVDGGLITDRRRLLDIKKGKRGLAQSEMFFAHINNFPGLYQQALEDLDPAALLAICVSEKPRNAEGSYMPAFRGGHDLARVIAASLSLPLYTTSHQEGHLAAALWSLEDQSETLPCLSGIKDGEKFLALHLSGGTSEILLAQRLAGGFQTEILATADLAAGQFIDRIGVALGLDFPCGQALEKLALAEGKSSFQLPMSVQKTKFSFSGPESAAQRIIKQGCLPSEMAVAVFDCIGRTLAQVLQNISFQTGCKRILLAGGVMANSLIRCYLKAKLSSKMELLFADSHYAGDNSVGVAVLGLEKYQAEKY